ncbi:LCP family protein [Arthrobacter sp. Edens01]|uniref:LCP family protein n=1 Tax=Arthrobacter sp. Edens01 TaxID=1732020 RepID=UPI0006DA9AC5|nr:LCP family protein [Arthrobacter sp. Edens01]KPN18304.1 transcriptional regulator [Arthrobacter sp. Edens01]
MTDLFSENREHAERKRRPVLKTVLVMATIVLIAGLAAGGYLYSLARTFDSGAATIPLSSGNAPPKTSDAEDTVNILVLGSDSREPGAAARSDALMLLHIPGDRQGIYAVSIMRDTWTTIPGHGEYKINAAMALGGVPLVVDTVQDMFGVPIDHAAVIDFEGFKDLTTALGGVSIQNPVAFQATGEGAAYFPAGTVTVEGAPALEYVRERYAFDDGDYQRVRNQQAFLHGLLSKLISTETLGDPVKLHGAIASISPYLSVDEGLTGLRVGTLALELRSVRSGDIEMFTLPNAGVGTSADGQSIVLPDATAAGELAEALKTDTVAQYAAGLNGE